MSSNFQVALVFFINLLAITNPFGNSGVYLGLVGNRSKEEQNRIAIKTAFASMIIFFIVTWVGQSVLDLLHLSIYDFKIAGGLVLVMIGLSMLKSEKSTISHTQEEYDEAAEKESIAIVPLAIPIIAGPGAISSILVALEHYNKLPAKIIMSGIEVLVAIVIAAVLYFAAALSKCLGVSGIKIITRIMGLIIIAIAFDMITSGLGKIYPGWLGSL